MNQTEYAGIGSITKLRNILQSLGAKTVLVCHGKNSYTTSGAKEELERTLAGYDYSEFSNFSPNPKEEEAREAYHTFTKKKYDALIGIGGGSTLDIAKAIKLFLHEEKKRIIPLIAIPTTAGSGSEATYFIVYYQGKEKKSMGTREASYPEYVILDPRFALKSPPLVTAAAGMDALGQAIESAWSIHSTEQSKKYSYEAITILKEHLEQSILHPSLKSREQLLKAANLSGKAINITKTTACHSIAYPMTSYFGIPHGHAVGLTLGALLCYNEKVQEKDCSDTRGKEFVKKTIQEIVSALGCSTTEEAAQWITECMMLIGLNTQLSDMGLQEKDLEIIIAHGFTPERVKNNPRIVTRDSLKTILKTIF